jgi:hypothetical protein
MMTHSDRAEPQGMTIEKLLQLKRAERPASEFWDRFEHDLRAKQLAAIVEKRPWWMALHLPARYPSFRRLALPIGAAVALVATFSAMREQGVTPRINPELAASSGTARTWSKPKEVALLTPPLATATPIVAAPKHAPLASSAPQPVVKASDELASSAAPLIAESRARVSEPVGLMEMIPWAASFRVESRQNVPRRPIDYAELPHVHFASAVLHGQEFDFNGRVDVDPTTVLTPRMVVVASKASVDQSVPSLNSREVRRTRILSNLNVADGGAEGEHIKVQGREMLVSALDDHGLSDSARRLGMGGDRLTLKF